MYLSVYVPFLITAVFAACAPRLTRRLPPAVGTWLLSVGGLLTAATSIASLTLLGFTLIGQNSVLAQRGQWSDAALRHHDPVATPIAALALITIVVLAARFAAVGGRRLFALRDAYALANALPGAGGELAVIDGADVQAYAVPGRPGRIVVSRGLLRSFDADERRAVLAHERAHLAHHHHLHQTVAQLAAAANPTLFRLPAAVSLSTERWADEVAAKSCHRTTVAAALAHAAIDGIQAHPTPLVALGAAATDVLQRVHALRAPAPRLTLWRVTLVAALLLATVAAVLEAAHDTEHIFELAQAAARHGHG